mmetsp:Transcript_32295/g.66578  ORF Transcript_32295/g.66578 Transcript_32295/m.66578 type:complete len:169 (+) Transcript_32295:77-583(+)
MSVDRVLAPTGHRVRKIEGQVFAAVLFLDIDGVLHPVNAEEDEFFGGSQMEQLRRIVEASGAQVVLSSTWRLSPVHMRQATERLEAVSMLLKPQGETPNLQRHGRAAEIRAWLDDHPCERWVAIDDLPLDEELPAEHVVRTEPFRGLTAEAACEAIGKLGRSSKLPQP